MIRTDVAPSLLRQPLRSGAVGVRAAIWLGMLLRIFLVVLALGTGLAVIAAVRGVLVYGEWMYTDVVLLHAAMRVRDGLSIYPDVSKPPFLFLHYGPLYPLAIGLISRVADLGLLETLYVARALTVLSTVIAAGSIAGLATLCGAGRTGAIVAAGMFVTAYVIHPWAYVARTDLPALGSVLLGMFVLLRSQTLSGALVGGLLLAVGFECKQTYGLAMAAAVLSLSIQRQWVRAIGIATAWITLVGFTALVMTPLTDGRYLEQAVGNNVLPFRAQTAWTYVSQYVPTSLALIVFATFGLARNGASGPAGVTVRIYALLAILSGVVATARMGSSFNYLIETTALLAVMAGVGFDRLIALAGEAQTHAGLLAHRQRLALLAMPLSIVAIGALVLPLRLILFAATSPPDERVLVEALRDASGPVLTARHGLAAMVAGKEPIAGDPIGIASIALGGRWDPEPLHDMIRAREFALIALDVPAETVPERDGFPWWPPGTVELIRQHYTFDRLLDGSYLYVPSATTVAGDRSR